MKKGPDVYYWNGLKDELLNTIVSWDRGSRTQNPQKCVSLLN